LFVCCLLFVVCCLLFVVCCLLLLFIVFVVVKLLCFTLSTTPQMEFSRYLCQPQINAKVTAHLISVHLSLTRISTIGTITFKRQKMPMYSGSLPGH
jgi:hypothetical protein